MAGANGKRRSAPSPTSKTVRCAIYTRKSTDEGLDQEFNSLDAQREAAEAYIQSQRHEGWQALPDRYDDGGFSGGNLERPALRRLLAAVDARQVDCVVIYKIDRLSRSLLDFARIMESFDQHGVSLVSVTQQMNTTNSMGRPTLNVLLSFAQFEREIIAERTRDKLSAARRKGKWIGGHPVLGYDIDPKGRRLVVNKGEARRVKWIFAMYLEHQGLVPLLNELDRREWRTKRWITKSGKARGGKPFTKSSIHYLLTNVIYTGRVNHKGKIYPGEHEAIIGGDVWTAVQKLMKGNAAAGGNTRRNKHGALLRGLLHCASCGAPMVHNYTAKGSKRYRYYVCYSAQQRGWAKCETKSIAASTIESAVVSAIRKLGADPKVAVETARQAGELVVRRVEEIREDKDAARRDIRRLNSELGRLSTDECAARYDRVLAIEGEIRAAEERIARFGEELSEWEGQQVDEAELAQALTEFDSIWKALTTTEQTRLVGLLVDRVVYHGPTNKITVSFRSAGLHELCAGEKTER